MLYILLYKLSKNGEINAYDALIILLVILSMPDDLLLFCENTAVRSPDSVNSKSKVRHSDSYYGSVFAFGSVCSPNSLLSGHATAPRLTMWRVNLSFYMTF